jgi:hypothetical protein
MSPYFCASGSERCVIYGTLQKLSRGFFFIFLSFRVALSILASVAYTLIPSDLLCKLRPMFTVHCWPVLFELAFTLVFRIISRCLSVLHPSFFAVFLRNILLHFV